MEPNRRTALGLLLRRIRMNADGAERLPRDGRYLLVSNHRSPADAALTGYCLREPGLMLWESGALLHPGDPVVAYPEGRVNTGEALLAFSPDPFALAWQEKLPIVLASLRGTEGCETWLRRPIRATLRILGVIPAEQLGELDAGRLAQIARERITDDLLREE